MLARLSRRGLPSLAPRVLAADPSVAARPSLPRTPLSLFSTAPAEKHPKDAFRKRLEVENELALEGGGARRVAVQHSKGKLTARERLDLLLDPGSFREYDKLKTHRATEFGMADQVSRRQQPE